MQGRDATEKIFKESFVKIIRSLISENLLVIA